MINFLQNNNDDAKTERYFVKINFIFRYFLHFFKILNLTILLQNEFLIFKFIF